MADITHGTWIKDGAPVDKAFSNDRQVYSRNLLMDSGFESGKTPSGIVWITNDGSNRAAEVDPAINSYPTPLGNYMLRVENQNSDSSSSLDQYIIFPLSKPVTIKAGEAWTYSYYYATAGSAVGKASDYLLGELGDASPIFGLSMGHDSRDTSVGQTAWHRFVKTWTANVDLTVTALRFGFVKIYSGGGWLCIDNIKLAKEPTASPWTPAPEDILN